MLPILIRQPAGSSLCGQCCVAMAAGVSLERAVAAVGHQRKSGTTTADLVRGLRALDVACADRLRRQRKSELPPPRAIVRTANGRKAHWMLLWDGKVLDPEDRYPQDGWKIRSFLELW